MLVTDKLDKDTSVGQMDACLASRTALPHFLRSSGRHSFERMGFAAAAAVPVSERCILRPERIGVAAAAALPVSGRRPGL
eukprot:98673-Rhodomonas_salina.1